MEIKLRCFVTSPALWPQGEMYTENISRSGILIAWRGAELPLTPPMVGQIVTVEVELPAAHGFAPKCIHCQGAVTRVFEQEGECPRVAVNLTYMDFRSFHDRMRSFESTHPVVSTWMS